MVALRKVGEEATQGFRLRAYMGSKTSVRGHRAVLRLCWSQSHDKAGHRLEPDPGQGELAELALGSWLSGGVETPCGENGHYTLVH